MIWDIFFAPFAEFGFMRRAVLGCIAISIGATPGRRLPHAAADELDWRRDGMRDSSRRCRRIFDFRTFARCYDHRGARCRHGCGAPLGFRYTLHGSERRCESRRLLLISLALGVLIISTCGSNVDLMHVLFGSVLALDDAALILLCSIASLTVFILAAVFRPLVLECADPQFLRSVSSLSAATHLTFLALVVLNLVAGFQALAR